MRRRAGSLNSGRPRQWPAPAGAEGPTSVIAVIACATLAMGWVWALREARRHRNTIKTLTAETD